MNEITKEQIQIIVYYIDENRLGWLKKQLKELNLGINVIYFKGYTKEDCGDFITEKHSKFPEVERDGQLACTKTVGSVFYWFINHCKDKNFLITLEDDSCLLKNLNLELLINIIKIYNSNRDQIDYVSLGYLPFDFEKVILRNLPNNSGLFWDFWKNRKKNEDFDDVFGGQMLLFDRKTTEILSDIFYNETTKKIREKINERKKMGYNFSKREDVLLGDHIIPSILKQAVYYPPLCIEGDFKSNMGGNINNHELRPWDKYININNYNINS